jgi:hypothetical protein
MLPTKILILSLFSTSEQANALKCGRWKEQVYQLGTGGGEVGGAYTVELLPPDLISPTLLSIWPLCSLHLSRLWADLPTHLLEVQSRSVR